MTIKIQLPQDDEIKVGWTAKVFSDSGAEIEDITSIDISIRANEIIVATMDVCVNKLENMDNIHALLGTETLHDIAKLHGYELVRMPVIGSQYAKNVMKG